MPGTHGKDRDLKGSATALPGSLTTETAWGATLDDLWPDNAVPVYSGGFVRRVAGTPHYDGALAKAAEPAVIAVTGMGPVRQAWVDPAQPPLRRV
jgi:hypothetical protein